MSNEIQRPMFASASAHGQGADDFDLNEIFADYFISEFEDPHNAYTNAMANYVGAPGVAVAAAPTPLGQPMQHLQQQQQGISNQHDLPTSGIRTAYHAAAAAAAPQPSQNYQAAGQQSQQQQQQQQDQPLSKKPRIANVASSGGVTSRLGVPIPLMPGQNGGMQPSLGGGGITLPSGHLGTVGQPGGVNVALPVGVGIRLGGAGGVAPATAQNAARMGGIIWGGPQMAGMSDHAIAERRQRNREHAKRSRVRKKFMLESLQEQVAGLQRENQRLRLLVQDNIPEHAQQIISECCSSSPLFSDDERAKNSQPKLQDENGETRIATALVRSDFQLMDSLSAGQQNFVLSDPRLPDNPIVFATPGFYRLTGYTPEQVLGRNCRFLQGPGTDPKSVDIIRKAIATGSDCTVCILNYKADGTPFWNQFFVAALRDSDNCIVNYVGVQTEVEPDAGANALEDRVNAVLPLANKEDEEDENGN
ncbi:PAS/PAC sensor hybrid histidine kinase [Nitzschia inconspicua]|uniref:PAS/PAC sensor hybrid histidine kinase n=1 Tax=Nitzschia inconspicua TaxID=303405 RepID=A0A9K3L6X9_9STRA|nr:PAS/PAC sensor hybrid histidine kinase [Nitzschia inconspicua]